jgi:hypothetical protein
MPWPDADTRSVHASTCSMVDIPDAKESYSRFCLARLLLWVNRGESAEAVGASLVKLRDKRGTARQSPTRGTLAKFISVRRQKQMLVLETPSTFFSSPIPFQSQPSPARAAFAAMSSFLSLANAIRNTACVYLLSPEAAASIHLIASAFDVGTHPDEATPLGTTTFSQIRSWSSFL